MVFLGLVEAVGFLVGSRFEMGWLLVLGLAALGCIMTGYGRRTGHDEHWQGVLLFVVRIVSGAICSSESIELKRTTSGMLFCSSTRMNVDLCR